MKRFATAFFILQGACLLPARAAPVPGSPENDTYRLSRRLKPIPNLEWEGIAGGRIAETYEVVKGDTLWQVSQRLFGDPRYWPKIWSINNGSITNPHLIRPGKKVVFLPGTETSLPGVSIVSASDAPSAIAGGENPKGEGGDEVVDPQSLKRSSEWKTLPTQTWERNAGDVIPESQRLTVADGGVRALRMNAEPIRTELDSVLGAQPPNIWGEIVGARSEATRLSIGDLVFVKSPYDLQTGKLYTVIGDSHEMRSPFTDRMAFLSPKLATIKIIGIRDRMFVASVTQANDVVMRGNRVVDYIPGAPKTAMVPGSSPLEGMILSDPKSPSRMISTNHQYYVDRGTRDGIQAGMVFRSFQHRDTSTGKKITDADFLIDSDFQVIYAAEGFSTVICLSGQAQIGDRLLAKLLLDVRDAGTMDENTRVGAGKEALGANPAFHDLEKINEVEGIGHDEEQELNQIESLPSNELPGTGLIPPGKTTDDLRIRIPEAPPPPDTQLEDTQLPPPPGYDPELDEPSALPPPPPLAPKAPAPAAPARPPEVPTEMSPPPAAPKGIELPSAGEPAPNGDELPLPPPPQ